MVVLTRPPPNALELCTASGQTQQAVAPETSCADKVRELSTSCMLLQVFETGRSHMAVLTRLPNARKLCTASGQTQQAATQGTSCADEVCKLSSSCLMLQVLTGRSQMIVLTRPPPNALELCTASGQTQQAAT